MRKPIGGYSPTIADYSPTNAIPCERIMQISSPRREALFCYQGGIGYPFISPPYLLFPSPDSKRG